MSSYSKELLKGTADTLVLSCFTDGEKYGYQVVKQLAQRSDGFFHLKEGTLYPILHRLEKQGLLAARWETMVTGIDRRYYSLTPKGDVVLADRLREWDTFSGAVTRVTRSLKLDWNEA